MSLILMWELYDYMYFVRKIPLYSWSVTVSKFIVCFWNEQTDITTAEEAQVSQVFINTHNVKPSFLNPIQCLEPYYYKLKTIWLPLDILPDVVVILMIQSIKLPKRKTKFGQTQVP